MTKTSELDTEGVEAMRIALVGTRGVPALYGGFETAAEEVGRRLVAMGHDVVVYCRNPGQTVEEHLGMRLVNLPALRVKVGETLSHTAVSARHLAKHPTDVAIVFNAANAPFVPLIRRAGIPVAVHVDGLEWARGKWGPIGRRYYLACERLAVRWADDLIADARAIQHYYATKYRKASTFIAYGAPILTSPASNRLRELDLAAGGFHLVVARLEPENNVDLIVDGFLRSTAALPLVVVGGAPYGSTQVDRVREMAARDPRIHLVGPMYDQELLDQLYAHALTYLHGHSVGGTNPSLLRAMGAAAAVNAIDVAFTREVLADTGQFFRDPDDVARLTEEAEAEPAQAAERGRKGQARAAANYDWNLVARDYEALCERLLVARQLGRMSADTHGAESGRRVGLSSR